MGKVSLDQVVASVNDIPSLPLSTVQVIKLTRESSSTAEDVSRVITRDQGLTAKILKLANSAYYGFPRRIGTVTEAVVLLGFQTIRSIVIAASVSDLLDREVRGYALAAGELWRHSQASAIVARYIARTAKFANREEAYTAALLHDIGKVVLSQHLVEYYDEVVGRAEGEKIPFIQAEEEVLGFTHAAVGSRVADKWNLPAELVEAIAHHHSPELVRLNPRLTAIVHLADAMTMMMGIGLGVDGLDYRLDSDSLHRLGLSAADIEAIIAGVGDILQDPNSFLL